jgi:hypothetical protein
MLKVGRGQYTPLARFAPCCPRSHEDIYASLDGVGCADRLPAAALLTLSYYYLFLQYNYAVKGFASLTLAKKQFRAGLARAEKRAGRTKFFFFTRPYGVTGYVITGNKLRPLCNDLHASLLLKPFRLQRRKKMIQILNERQFVNAAARVQKERMLVQRAGFRRYFVTNKAKGTRYEVFFSRRRDGKKFGACNCPAGYPMDGRRAPQICKHLYVALSLHIALMSQEPTSH